MLAAVWGSFLNVLGYRLIHGINIALPRSFCIHCQKQIAWYDTIPLFSYLVLKARCRSCKQRISFLYPFIEAITITAALALYYLVDPSYWLGYGLFFSALIVTIRSDLETMLISRYVTLYLIPLGILLSTMGWLPLDGASSVIGALAGYLFLKTVASFFAWYTGKEGVGLGDIELLAFIGSFTGIVGCWATITLGSIFGSVIAILYILLSRKSIHIKIPFGPFLAVSAMIYVLAYDYLLSLLTS